MNGTRSRRRAAPPLQPGERSQASPARALPSAPRSLGALRVLRHRLPEPRQALPVPGGAAATWGRAVAFASSREGRAAVFYLDPTRGVFNQLCNGDPAPSPPSSGQIGARRLPARRLSGFARRELLTKGIFGNLKDPGLFSQEAFPACELSGRRGQV